jgi:hypothetical protein
MFNPRPPANSNKSSWRTVESSAGDGHKAAEMSSTGIGCKMKAPLKPNLAAKRMISSISLRLPLLSTTLTPTLSACPCRCLAAARNSWTDCFQFSKFAPTRRFSNVAFSAPSQEMLMAQILGRARIACRIRAVSNVPLVKNSHSIFRSARISTRSKNRGFIKGSPIPLSSTLSGVQGRRSRIRRSSSSVRCRPVSFSRECEQLGHRKLHLLVASICILIGSRRGHSGATNLTLSLNGTRFQESRRRSFASARFSFFLMLAVMFSFNGTGTKPHLT